MNEPRGEMTADEFLAWVDTHPSWPPHPFEEPCGQFEGTDHCWLCGSARAAHPRAEPTREAER